MYYVITTNFESFAIGAIVKETNGLIDHPTEPLEYEVESIGEYIRPATPEEVKRWERTIVMK
jgi:hypothetical protein